MRRLADLMIGRRRRRMGKNRHPTGTINGCPPKNLLPFRGPGNPLDVLVFFDPRA